MSVGAVLSSINNVLGIIPRMAELITKPVGATRVLSNKPVVATTQMWLFLTAVNVIGGCAYVTNGEGSDSFINCVQTLCSLVG